MGDPRWRCQCLVIVTETPAARKQSLLGSRRQVTRVAEGGARETIEGHGESRTDCG